MSYLKNIISFLSLVFFLMTVTSKGQQTNWNQWHEEQSKKLQQTLQLSPQEQIPILGQMVRIGYDTPRNKLNEKRLDIYLSSQAALLSIPGHAEYYRDRINEARLRFEAADKSGDEHITDRAATKHELSNEQMYGFQTLSQLPSVETVKVLGEFLFDERGRMTVPPDQKGKEYALHERWLQEPNSDHAAFALQQLPLKTKPHGGDPGWYAEDIRPWLLWYEQIKAGNRTFSFEGDPTEYNLSGPVKTPKTPEASRTLRRPIAEAPVISQPLTSKKTESRAPVIIAIIGAILLGGGYWIYRRQVSARS
jgi:hypothetical protein